MTQALLTDPAAVDGSRVTLRIPRVYHGQPVIAYLVKTCGLDVNIYAAQLSGHGQDDGWFDLGLRGSSRQISEALAYLDSQSVEVWTQTREADADDW